MTTPTSGAADLPEALRIADILDLLAMDMKTPRQAAAELRRQHIEITDLRAQLESIGAGGVSGRLVQAISAEPAGAGYAPLTGRTHELKTDAAVFAETLAGRKLFEIRKNDRDYQCGDILRLRATRLTGAEMAAGQPLIYTGQEELRRVVSIVRGPRYGLAEGWVIMSVMPVSERASHGQAPAQPNATPHPACKADILVNGGALKLALNVLRRAGKNEVADELETTATPQAADTPAQQPAPAREGGGYPPLPDPFTQLVRKTSWHAECWEAAPAGAQLYGRLWADERKDTYTAPQMRAYVDSDRAARAQAESVLEDAARLEFAMQHGMPMECGGMYRYHGFWEAGWHATKVAAIDAAMNKGGAA